MAERKLGDLTVGVQVDTKGLKTGLTGAEGQVGTSSSKMGAKFKALQGKVQGVAGEIPIIGSSLASLVSPAGLATTAIGLITTAIVGSIKKVVELERELRPLLARSGLTAEGLQALSKAAVRLGSEDGLEGVADSVQELQLRLAEAVQDGTGPAVAAFDKLGLSSLDLINASPEESFLAVITALQGLNNQADKKFLADELMGGSSEKLAGIIGATSEEFQTLTKSIRENADIVSGDALEAARELDREMSALKATAGKVQTEIATRLIPAINSMVDATKAYQGKWAERFQDDIDDITGAWNAITGLIDRGLNAIVETYNNTVAVLPWFDEVDTSGLEAELSDADEALGDTAVAAEDVGTASTEMATVVERAATTSRVAVKEMATVVISDHMRMVESNRNHADRVDALTARRRQAMKEEAEAANETAKIVISAHQRIVEANRAAVGPCRKAK